METEFAIEELGCVPYAEALEQMEKQVEARRSGAAGDTLFLLEHPPVVTLGRSGKLENLRLSPDELAARAVEVHWVRRGGDVTYHGPGQLVGYLVVDLAARGMADVGVLLRGIEGALCEALEWLGVSAATIPGYTGVFVANTQPPRKIASIGVGLRGWVTYHGFALNVSLDPADFDMIVPCGLHDIKMTSIVWERDRVSHEWPFLSDRPPTAAAPIRELACPNIAGGWPGIFDAAHAELAAAARASVAESFRRWLV